MTKQIPKEVITIYKRLQDESHEVFFVGGCVRGLLMGTEVTDWDFATSATPDIIQKLFPESFYDNPFGTVGIPYEIDGLKQVVEITTFRHEGVYRDKRRPDNVTWGETIHDDLARRDFTINAIAAKIVPKDSESALDFIDPHQGMQDLEDGIVRAVGEADVRFREDSLRMMRAVRIATQLQFEIEDVTLNAIRAHVASITSIAYERIRDEFFKILSSNYPAEGVLLLDKVGILELTLPELTRGKGVSMVRPGRHHTTDVFEHNILALKHCPSSNPVVRLATLLHDVGKPDTRGEDAEGLVVFYNHEVVGAHIVKHIADRFRLSKKQKDKLYILVRWHMFSVDEDISEKAIRRFIRRVGIDNIQDMIDLRIGDRLGSGASKAESWRLKRFQERITQELNPPLTIHDLAIGGHDVMKVLDMPPGPQIGKILQVLFEEVDENPDLNTREYLEKRMREFEKNV